MKRVRDEPLHRGVDGASPLQRGVDDGAPLHSVESALAWHTRRVAAAVSPPDAATLAYAFALHKYGLLVSLSGDGACAVRPLVNRAYDNALAWADGLGAPHAPLLFRRRGGALTRSHAEYAADKRGAQGARRAETEEEGYVADPRGWWLNGHVVCNVENVGGWSQRGTADLTGLLTAAAAARRGATPRLLLLNKRDAPWLKADGASPFDALWGAPPPPLHPLHARPMTRPLSLYGGRAWADVLLPLPEAWAAAAHAATGCGCAPDSACALVRRALGWTEGAHAAWWAAHAPPPRAPLAVFRGTPTGAGSGGRSNQRLALCARRHPALDAGVTAWNARDRVHGGVVSFQAPEALREEGVRLLPPLSPGRQAARYRAIVYAAGHSAASRLLWNLASGRCVLALTPPPTCVAPSTWLHGAVREGVHVLPVADVGGGLDAALGWVAGHDEDARAMAWRAVRLVQTPARPRSASSCRPPSAQARRTSSSCRRCAAPGRGWQRAPCLPRRPASPWGGARGA